MYEMAPDQLERFRRGVSEDRSGRELERLVADARGAGLTVAAHDELKTAPRGYPKDHPRIDLLRYKGIITWTEWAPGAWLGTKKAKERVATTLERSQPIVRWLRKNVGDSTLPPSR
jgi:uncharacterized protein (DUF2461 family)